uniref:Uncharacterized protein n=1 Tax=Arundo donax TaxID=35708 RepID=A0A0A9F187_ARUDO
MLLKLCNLEVFFPFVYITCFSFGCRVHLWKM